MNVEAELRTSGTFVAIFSFYLTTFWIHKKNVPSQARSWYLKILKLKIGTNKAVNGSSLYSCQTVPGFINLFKILDFKKHGNLNLFPIFMVAGFRCLYRFVNVCAWLYSLFCIWDGTDVQFILT